MPFRNDQLVGCLTDMQNLEDDLEDLINDQNQHQYNQYNVDQNQHLVDAGQMTIEQSASLHQGARSGQFETVAFDQSNSSTGYLLDPTASRTTNFDFNPTDFSKQQLDYVGQSTGLDAFDTIDDELELHHLKELEDLMETNQSARIDNLNGPVGLQLNGPANGPVNGPANGPANRPVNSPMSGSMSGPMSGQVNGPMNGPVSQCSSIGSELSGNRAGANLPSGLSVGIHNLPSNLPAPTPPAFLVHANQQASRANSLPTAFENNRSSFNASAKVAAASRLLPSSIQADSSVRNDNSFLSSAAQTNSTCSNFLKPTGASFGHSASPTNYPQLTSSSPNELGAYCDPLLGNSLNNNLNNNLNSNLSSNLNNNLSNNLNNNLSNNLSSNLNNNLNCNLNNLNNLNSNLNSNRTANNLPNNLQPSDLRAPPSDSSYSASQSPNHLPTISSKLQSPGQDQPAFNDFDMPATMLKTDLGNCFVGQSGQLAVGQLCNAGQMMMAAGFTNSANLQQQHPQHPQQPLPTASLPSMFGAAQSPVMQHLPQLKASSSSSSSSSARSPSNEWFDTVVQRLLSDMQRCGICVIDNFLGSSFCDTILSEVVDMYSEGCFKDGLLVGSQSSGDKNIRGDKIHWVEGKEPNCLNIGYLMRTLDQILMRFSRLNVDGRQILNRTKAMIACYPANGTKYVKHVDNPNEDGRYITCIYYLNKSWQSQRDGGTLRIFPKNLPYVANIEPLFDRVIFFWSDRRNPHEVMPAYSIRFAITLWYFNSQEREQYIKKMQALQGQS